MMGKLFVAAVWLYSLACMAVPSLPLSRAGALTFWFMLGAHVIELAVFRRRIIHAPGSTTNHVLQVLLFGFFHARNLEDPGRP